MTDQIKILNHKDSEAKEEAGAQAIASKANKKKKTQKSPPNFHLPVLSKDFCTRLKKKKTE